MAKEYNQEKIENFVRGLMGEEERQQFSKDIAANSDLKDEVAFQQDLAAVVRKRRLLKDIRSELSVADFFKEESLVVAGETKEEQGAKVVQMPKRTFGRVSKYLAYAASLAVLVTVGLANLNYSNKSLRTFTIEGRSTDVRSRTDNNVQDPFDEGLTAIEEKNYEQAIAFFESIPEKSENYNSALLFLAASQYEFGDYDAAINSAKKLTNSQRRVIATTKFDAQWILVQAKLGKGELDEAFYTQLNAIADNNNHDKQTAAQELQAQLNSFWRKLVIKK
ncbi:MAG: hypothetical protein AAF849_05710 [Bacteroidota bacterium]